ncbi:LytR/AlgR family response regulator transcription factor [Maribacter halichondriae]|uniref:LytR/AlgR family response regulator transcription factor n=1 Tax=Maribacter halichondriae TaxID=2980554 RepID=UPI002359C461|nr:LytTR family DNA-binding domain-containing protein [Maribacter sp. Hal144]
MKCVIIEDEIPAQRILENYISKIPDLELIGKFQSALEANSSLRKIDVDVVFLDINLPDISGIQYIKTLAHPPAIIMTTAYHEHAVASFELDTICDYLVKPFSLERFLKAINKLKKTERPSSEDIRSEERSMESIFLNIDKTLHKINVHDILYVESDKNYVTVATKNGKFTYLDSLKNWIQKLPESSFIQVHKSYIINFAEIEKINGNLVFICGEKIRLGRVYKSMLLKKLKLN